MQNDPPNTSPRVSVLLPVWNGADCLEATVAHVLKQSFPDFELLVLDDGSTDDTWKIMGELQMTDSRIRLIQNTENLGIIKSLNKLGAMAQGEFLAREDCGDLSASDRYEMEVRELDAYPEAVAVVSDFWLLSDEGDPLAIMTMPESVENTLPERNPVCHPTLMMRASAFRECGGYSEEFAHVEDYDLMWRLAATGPFRIIRKPLIASRLNPRGITFRNIEVQNYYAEKVRARYAGRPEPAPLSHHSSLPENLSDALYRRKIGKLHLSKLRKSKAQAEFRKGLASKADFPSFVLYLITFLPTAAFRLAKRLKSGSGSAEEADAEAFRKIFG